MRLSSKETYRLCTGSRNFKSGQGPTKSDAVILLLIIIISNAAEGYIATKSN
jgi:hypothetical protein